MEKFNNFLALNIISIGKYTISVYTLMMILIIILITKIVLLLIRKALFRRQNLNNHDPGNTYALFQIIKYVFWILAFGIILDNIGIKITILLTGSAALLVGVGLGLQQTFNDIISGIILLAERSIKIDDILEIDGDIVRIDKIGFRTSQGSNRDEISIIIPNSLITTNKVINWSHQTKQTRFKLNVGVAYGSDVDLVMKFLTECVLEHPDIYLDNLVQVRLLEFGSSSINFQVLFYSENIFRIEQVKSEIRINIHKKFKENNITLPFAQMDLHLISNNTDLVKDNEKNPQ